MMFAKLSTAITISFGPVLDSAGAEYTSAVVGDVKISKNNGTPAALNASATLTHKEVGIYELVLTTSDISAVGQATLTLSKTTYVAPPRTLIILPATTYDAIVTNAAGAAGGMLYIGSNAATTFAGASFTGSTFAGVINVSASTWTGTLSTVTLAQAQSNVTFTGALATFSGLLSNTTTMAGAISGVTLAAAQNAVTFSGLVSNTTTMAGAISGVALASAQGAVTFSGLLSNTTTFGGSIADSSGVTTLLAQLNRLIIHSGTAQSAMSDCIVLDSGASSINNTYTYATVVLTGGTGAGEVRQITSYGGSTREASVSPDWNPVPDNTSTFAIIANTSWLTQFGQSPGGLALSVKETEDVDALFSLDSRIPPALVGGKMDAVADVDESAIADAVVASIGGASITVQSPVLEDGTIEIVQGGDYTGTRSIVLTITGYAGPSLTSGTAHLTAMPTVDYNKNNGSADISKTGTVSQSGSTVTLTYTLAAADTSGLHIRPDDQGTLNYTYEAYAVTASTLLTIPLALGSMTITRSVG